MFKIFFWTMKTVFLVTAVLVLGNLLRWDGKTISDQVKTGMAHAEKISVVQSLKNWTLNWSRKATQSAHDQMKELEGMHIPKTEKEKLRALIRELNSTREK